MIIYCPEQCENNNNESGKCKLEMIILDETKDKEMFGKVNRLSCRFYKDRIEKVGEINE